MKIWTSGYWGTREQAIPGEWAALVLIMVIGAAAGFLVLWFTMLRQERTVLHRARRRTATALRPSLALEGLDLAEAADLVDVAGTAPLEPSVLGFAFDPQVGVGDGEAAVEDAGGAGDVSDAPSAAEVDDEDVDDEDDRDDEDGESGDGGARFRGAAGEFGPNAGAEIVAEPADDRGGERSDEDEPEGELAPASMVIAPTVIAAPLAAVGRGLVRSGRKPAKGQHRKLSDEMLDRVEHEITGREEWRYQDLAALVQREFGVSVHPSTIQRALKRRRLREVGRAVAGPAEAIDPASA